MGTDIKPVQFTEKEANVLATILSDVNNGDLEPAEGIEYDKQAIASAEQKLYDAGVDSEDMIGKSWPEGHEPWKREGGDEA